MTIIVAVYCISIGALIAAWWVNSLRLGAWNRGDRAHSELALHLTGEFGTAAMLIVAGIALLLVGPNAGVIAGAALGMLLYTAIVSPGYFLNRHETPVVAMFAGLCVATIAALVALVLS